MLLAVNRDRAVAIVASTGMILTWLANAASPRPEPAGSQAPPRAVATGEVTPSESAALTFDMERETERLRHRLAASPGPARSGRDPFRFGERRVAMSPRRATAPPQYAEVPVTQVAVDVPPPLRLIGVAERAAGETSTRTAVLSGESDVFLVGVGDQVLGRYTVVAVAAETIELSDASTGRVIRLALK
jgi:hypothetical protein